MKNWDQAILRGVAVVMFLSVLLTIIYNFVTRPFVTIMAVGTLALGFTAVYWLGRVVMFFEKKYDERHGTQGSQGTSGKSA